MAIESRKEFQPELYRSYLGILARRCLHNLDHLRRKLDSSDIVQDAMLRALVALPQFRGSTEREFTAWLREILENKLLDAAKRYRRKKRDAKLEEVLGETLQDSSMRLERHFERVVAADQTSPSEHVARNERVRLLADGLAALPEDQRTALEFHHLNGYSLGETARLMNRTTVSVAGLLRRGLKTMRRDLKDREQDLQ